MRITKKNQKRKHNTRLPSRHDLARSLPDTPRLKVPTALARRFIRSPPSHGHCAPPRARADAVRRLAHTAVGADAHGPCWRESKHFGQANNYRRAYRSSKVPDHARSIAVAAERIARTDHTCRHYSRPCCRRVAFTHPRCAQQAPRFTPRAGSQHATAETHYGSRHIQASLTGPVRHAIRAPPDQPPGPQPDKGTFSQPGSNNGGPDAGAQATETAAAAEAAEQDSCQWLGPQPDGEAQDA